MLDFICNNSSPELDSSIKAENTSVGGGKRVLFIKPLVGIVCHRIMNIKIGTIT